jgi:orotate phosphoribosyltransferase
MDPRRSPNNLEARARAFSIIKEQSYSEGDFTLASGRKSKFYLDLKPTMLNPEGANALAELILNRIYALQVKVDFVGGLDMGAVPLVTATALLSANTPRPLPGFIVRKDVKNHGTMKRIESAGNLCGKNVVVLDDVTTSGDSAMLAVDAARQAGANVVLVLSIVDRGEGAAEFYERKGIPFNSLFLLPEFRASTHSNFTK